MSQVKNAAMVSSIIYIAFILNAIYIAYNDVETDDMISAIVKYFYAIFFAPIVVVSHFIHQHS